MILEQIVHLEKWLWLVPRVNLNNLYQSGDQIQYGYTDEKKINEFKVVMAQNTSVMKITLSQVPFFNCSSNYHLV